MRPTALDIAKYILYYEDKNNRSVSNLRLQKLLYFIQAQCLVCNGRPCFDEDIEAWNFGSVVPSVYHEYKLYGSSSIPCFENKLNIWNIKIQDDIKESINLILDACSDLSTTYLLKIIHCQKPWISAYYRSFNNKISNKELFDFFKKD